MEKLRLKGAPSVSESRFVTYSHILVDNDIFGTDFLRSDRESKQPGWFASICIQPQIPGNEHSPQMAMRNEWEVTLKGPDLVQVERRVFPSKSEFKLWVPSWMH